MTNYCTLHSHRVTIQAKVTRLVDKLRQLMGSTSHNGAAFCALAHNRVIAAACEREQEKEREHKREEEREVEEEQAPAKAPQKGEQVAKKGGRGTKAKAG
jgi:hypothetical protein